MSISVYRFYSFTSRGADQSPAVSDGHSDGAAPVTVYKTIAWGCSGVWMLHGAAPAHFLTSEGNIVP